ncbi:hypothetical protein A1O7_02317 [Cladophialophora yegresii CBS 114405]|uniref:N-acetyltransferase domain-containing protein n=1 Tax=Cladophialophora yegresii CBS 114405 TaxID=1182544 RepID=W9WBF7_9EURO|nr:uncharacterized protein A1O7_02317 [Cladophialophora yegresii CBS 114405]EXJ61886.1 hypothetical protein A1O7_02317 [Cladophialophora yegresii CBS 114405]
MTSPPDPEMPLHTWTKDDKYLVSTDASLIPLQALNTAIFGAGDFTWGGPLPEEQLRTLVQRSLCFGLYELQRPQGSTSTSATRSYAEHHSSTEEDHRQHEHQHPESHSDHSHPQPQLKPQQPQHRLIGFARFITDLVTVNYLTDVYVLREHRSHGLGIWLMQCIDEVFASMTHLRGMILIADRGSSTEDFYRKYLAMGDLEGKAFCMDRKGLGVAEPAACLPACLPACLLYIDLSCGAERSS